MTEELREFIMRIGSHNSILEIYNPNTASIGLSKLVINERIDSLIRADEKMCDSMIDYAKKATLEGVDTRDLAIQRWQETHWHKIIKIEIDNLRKLKEELEEIK